MMRLIMSFLLLGEWQSRFDSKFTVKDFFYIDKKTSVKVDMMMATRYPLSMFVDLKDGTQVLYIVSFIVLVILQTLKEHFTQKTISQSLTHPQAVPGVYDFCIY